MVFSKRKIDSTLHLKIGGLAIKRVSTFKLLGLYIDKKIGTSKLNIVKQRSQVHCMRLAQLNLYLLGNAYACCITLWYTLIFHTVFSSGALRPNPTSEVFKKRKEQFAL